MRVLSPKLILFVRFPVPDFIESPENVTAVLGEKGYLPCKVSGSPKPKVIWYSRRIGRLQYVPGKLV